MHNSFLSIAAIPTWQQQFDVEQTYKPAPNTRKPWLESQISVQQSPRYSSPRNQNLYPLREIKVGSIESSRGGAPSIAPGTATLFILCAQSCHLTFLLRFFISGESTLFAHQYLSIIHTLDNISRLSAVSNCKYPRISHGIPSFRGLWIIRTRLSISRGGSASSP